MLYAKTIKVVPQILADLGLVAWATLWVFLGIKVHGVFLLLTHPAFATQESAQMLSDLFLGAAQSVHDVPVVGSLLEPPLDSFGSTMASLVAATMTFIHFVQITAVVLGIIVVAVPVVLYLWKWLPWRFAFVREATAGKRLIPADASPEFFALRAIAGAPMRDLARITPDPMGAWNRGDPEVIRRLANLELRRTGLKLPRPRTGVKMISDLNADASDKDLR